MITGCSADSCFCPKYARNTARIISNWYAVRRAWPSPAFVTTMKFGLRSSIHLCGPAKQTFRTARRLMTSTTKRTPRNADCATAEIPVTVKPGKSNTENSGGDVVTLRRYIQRLSDEIIPVTFQKQANTSSRLPVGNGLIVTKSNYTGVT